MLGDIKPFKIIGNIYFVGTHKASSHLIDTGEGLILIDSGYEETADVIVESVTELGFDIKNVKYIIHSHGHSDHTDGTPKLVALSGAKTFLAEADIKYISGWMPDHFLCDGDIIKLGNTEILCLATPGHTEGTTSFFFHVEENGQIYRAGMFGGAGTNQLKKDYLDRRGCSYLNRGLYFKSIEKLKKEHVDVFLGNHVWDNQMKEKYAKMQTSDKNPFIDETQWVPFLERKAKALEDVILYDSRERFVNYAHRGASEYVPENTFLSFYTGMYMGANGIETDVQMTKDGVLVLFHDKNLERLAGQGGSISDYTLEELQQLTFEKNGLKDKIVVFEEFLKHFSFRDITFAIEIKQPGIEKEIADMLRKYNMHQKTVVTSFMPECIQIFKEYAPEYRVGFLTKEVNEETLEFLKKIGADELCPYAPSVTADNVEKWHREGFNVRAWGVGCEELMRNAYDCMTDGMTVNFPDKLTAYMFQQRRGYYAQ